MGDSVTWCERSMEISMNEIHTLELLCMSSFETMTFKGPDGSLRNTQYLYHLDVPSEIMREQMGGTLGVLHKRGLSWEYPGTSPIPYVVL